jgi:hypothetical protein
VEGQKIEEGENCDGFEKTPGGDSQPSWQRFALTFIAGAVLGIAMSKTRVGRR